MFDLTGKTALVTGASGGIGGAIAKALHAQGAVVVLSGTKTEALEKLATELGSRAFTAASGLAAVVGALVGGELGQRLGSRPTLLIACVGLALAPAFCLASPLRRLRVMEPLEVDRHAAG